MAGRFDRSGGKLGRCFSVRSKKMHGTIRPVHFVGGAKKILVAARRMGSSEPDQFAVRLAVTLCAVPARSAVLKSSIVAVPVLAKPFG